MFIWIVIYVYLDCNLCLSGLLFMFIWIVILCLSGLWFYVYLDCHFMSIWIVIYVYLDCQSMSIWIVILCLSGLSIYVNVDSYIVPVQEVRMSPWPQKEAKNVMVNIGSTVYPELGRHFIEIAWCHWLNC